MKLNTKQAIKQLDGKDAKDPTGKIFSIGEALSNILISAKEGGKMKMFILAQKAFEGKELDLDEADLNLIRKTIEQSEVYTNLVTGQLLILLENKK